MALPVLVLVEGRSEKQFVNILLAPFFREMGIFLRPTVMLSRANPKGPDFKGGVTHYASLRRQPRSLLRHPSVLVTTLIDFYGLPKDFPGMDNRPAGEPIAQVQHVPKAIQRDLGNPRNFLPFLMLHEFEAVLFASSTVLPALMQATARQRKDFASICRQFPTPEAINASPSGSPSHRIFDLFPDFAKQIHGEAAFTTIGLELIRNACPHLRSWLDALASYATVCP